MKETQMPYTKTFKNCSILRLPKMVTPLLVKMKAITKARKLCEQGHPVAAIKLLRDKNPRLGLRGAKDWVEREYPRRFQDGPGTYPVITTLEKQLKKRKPMLASDDVRKTLTWQERAAVRIFYHFFWKELERKRWIEGDEIGRRFERDTMLEILALINNEMKP